jgi:N-dimethylarginine dimethylaminohydrolase
MDKEAHFGCQSMIAPLRRVIVRRPDEVFGNADPDKWHYTGRPDLKVAQDEHDAFVSILRDAGSEIIYHEESLPNLADSIFVHDPAIITERGAIILRMGKNLRRGEEEAMTRCLESAGVPILHVMSGEATAEGGDFLWVDRATLAVGLGTRTNAEGFRQVESALARTGVKVIPVPLPEYGGPETCLHLMSLISIVHRTLAVVYLPLLPRTFTDYLRGRGFRFVEVPHEEFATMGPNVLALAPGHCLMLEGNPVTRDRLENVGCRIHTYKGDEISFRAEGGPTCLTRPILRQ